MSENREWSLKKICYKFFLGLVGKLNFQSWSGIFLCSIAVPKYEISLKVSTGKYNKLKIHHVTSTTSNNSLNFLLSHLLWTAGEIPRANRIFSDILEYPASFHDTEIYFSSMTVFCMSYLPGCRGWKRSPGVNFFCYFNVHNYFCYQIIIFIHYFNWFHPVSFPASDERWEWNRPVVRSHQEVPQDGQGCHGRSYRIWPREAKFPSESVVISIKERHQLIKWVLFIG